MSDQRDAYFSRKENAKLEETIDALRSELAEARRLLEPFAQALDDQVDFDERPIGLRHIRAAADFLRRHPAK